MAMSLATKLKVVTPAERPGIEKLIAQQQTGVIAGFPCIDFQATLYDGAYHDVDSSVLAFEIAARAAFREVYLNLNQYYRAYDES